jgi:hypothetical protein
LDTIYTLKEDESMDLKTIQEKQRIRWIKNAYKQAVLTAKQLGDKAVINGMPYRLRIGRKFFYLAFWNIDKEQNRMDIIAAQKIGFETYPISRTVYLWRK